MHAKSAPRLRSQPTRLQCYCLASVPVANIFEYVGPEHTEPKLISILSSRDLMSKHSDNNYFGINQQSITSRQQGASTWLMALFVVAILVTAIVAALFGHKLGYQSGYYSLASESKQNAVISEQATIELKDLSISNKILADQAATAKQELTIGLSNLDELRKKQRELKVESSQVAQLNEIYANLISENGGMPLQVLGAKIEPLPENAFEYGFDVGMLSKDSKAKDLKATLTLQDVDNFIEVPLEPSRFVIKGIVRIRGRFVMPKGFKPLQVKLNLTADDEEVEQLYDWTAGEMVDNMPLSLLDLPEVDQSPISSSNTKINTKTKKSSNDK